MRQVIFGFLLCFLLFAGSAFTRGPVNFSINPDIGEHHPNLDHHVTLCIDPKWYPFEEITEDGQYVGISADLLGIISNKTGIKFDLVPTESWAQSLEYFKEGKCIALSFLNRTPDREEWILFTEPLYTDYNVFISREEHENITNPSNLTGKTVVLPRATSVEEIIRTHYPNLEIILTETEEDAFRMVSEKQADLSVRSLAMAAYVIKKEGWFNLKIAGHLPVHHNDLRMGISKEYPWLRDELDVAISTLSKEEIQNAVNNHISINILSPVNYKPFLMAGAALLGLILLGFLWNAQLRKLNRQLAEKQNRLLKLTEKQKSEIIAKKSLEEQLMQNQNMLNTMISNLPGFIYRCANDENYTMFYVSDACTGITGYLPEEFINNAVISFAELIDEQDIDTIKQLWDKSVSQNMPFQFEYRIKTRNGETRWIRERGRPILTNTGTLMYLEGFIDDITQRKKAEDDLRDSELKYRLITENASDVIWVLNLNKGGFTYISPSIYQLRGLTPEEAISESLEQALTPESYNLVMEITMRDLEAFKQNPKGHSYQRLTEIRQPCKDGSIIWVETATRFQMNEKGEIEVIGVSRNIEARKQYEKILEAKNKELESFLYITSHDLRSPLINIQGFGSRIQMHLEKIIPVMDEIITGHAEQSEIKELLHSKLPASLAMIVASADKMNDLINGLLTISRIGTIEMRIEDLNMDELMNKVIQSNAFRIEEFQGKIHTAPLPRCPGDRTLINQLFSNLLDNAIKYRHNGRNLEIDITATETAASVVYAIKDNGIGISERHRDKVWNIFFRVDPRSSEKGEGIGLNLVSKIIEKHNGRIWLETEEGVGSTFFVELPK
jgi:PAS domain S-box-containing protein